MEGGGFRGFFNKSGVLFLLKTPSRKGGACSYKEKPRLPILSMVRWSTAKNALNKGGNLEISNKSSKSKVHQVSFMAPIIMSPYVTTLSSSFKIQYYEHFSSHLFNLSNPVNSINTSMINFASSNDCTRFPQKHENGNPWHNGIWLNPQLEDSIYLYLFIPAIYPLFLQIELNKCMMYLFNR